MEVDKMCLKIDKPNAYAMIIGYPKNQRVNHQSIWCAVKDLPYPMLITFNRSRTHYLLSAKFKHKNLEKVSIKYQYIATLDSQYFIKNDIKMWEVVCNNGLFDIWHPESPFTRFDESKRDPSNYRIQLLRVYEIENPFHENDIQNSSSRIDHIIKKSRYVKIKQPVINDSDFASIKNLLKSSVKDYITF